MLVRRYAIPNFAKRSFGFGFIVVTSALLQASLAGTERSVVEDLVDDEDKKKVFLDVTLKIVSLFLKEEEPDLLEVMKRTGLEILIGAFVAV